MKSIRMTWLAGVFGLILATNSAHAGDQDFELVNKTGVEIHALYISPSGQEEWGEDVLGVDTLPSGDSVEIKFSPKEKADLWDLRIEDESGNAIEWGGLKLTEIAKVILKYNKKTGEATAETE